MITYQTVLDPIYKPNKSELCTAFFIVKKKLTVRVPNTADDYILVSIEYYLESSIMIPDPAIITEGLKHCFFLPTGVVLSPFSHDLINFNSSSF